MVCRRRRFGQTGYQGRQFEGFVFLSPRQGSPRSRQQGTVGGQYHLVLTQMEVFGKGLAKRRDKGQRTAAEQDRRLDVPSMGQRHHRLDGHGMEMEAAMSSRLTFLATRFWISVLQKTPQREAIG